MNDDELRQLIRAAIQKHTGAAPSSDFAHTPPGELRRDRLVPSSQPQVISISFGQYQLERAKDDTSCLIEPAVQCNHCGFCKCHGH
jgi:hypothetical protein